MKKVYNLGARFRGLWELKPHWHLIVSLINNTLSVPHRTALLHPSVTKKMLTAVQSIIPDQNKQN